MNSWSHMLQSAQAPVYLIYGTEKLMISQAIQWLKTQVLSGAMEDFNFDRFDASDPSFHISKVVAAADSPPMMSDRRLVWVQSCDILNAKSKDYLSEFLNYLQNPSPETCLILEAHKSLDKKKSLWKMLTKKNTPVHLQEFATLKGKDVTQWLIKQAKTMQLTIGQEAQVLIQESAEENLSVILDHLKKLKLYIHPRTTIEVQDVKDLIPEAVLQTTVWKLLDALSRKKVSDVLSMTHALLQQGQPELALFSLVIKQMRELTMAYAVKAQGGTEKDLVQLGKMPPFVAKKLMRLINSSTPIFKVNELMEAYQMLLHADRELKGSKVEASLVLENMLINLCLLGKT